MSGKININNYEAFLLDYMEGNLSGKDIVLLKEFVLLHPELEINLEDKELVTLEAENISLDSKQDLKKNHVSITDEQFVAYIENTLNEEERQKIDLACYNDALLAKELRLYKSTILKTDHAIVFENKSALKKQNKVIYFSARTYLSAAAALLLLLGLWFVFKNSDTVIQPDHTFSENKTTVNTNTINTVNPSTLTNQEPTLKNNNAVEDRLPSKTNLANRSNTPVINSFTAPLIANNKIDSVIKPIEEKIVVTKKDTIANETKIVANNPPVQKNAFIVTSGTDDDVANTPEPKKGFWNTASKALKKLNNLGVKKVDGQETVAVNNEQTVLSIGNFKIEKNKYNQE